MGRLARSRLVGVVAVIVLAVTAFVFSSVGIIGAQTVSVGANPNPVIVDNPTTITASLVGGPYGGPYGYGYVSYLWSGLPPGCPDPGNVPSFECTPTTVGSYDVMVTITTPDGPYDGSFILTVNPFGSFSSIPTTTQVNESAALHYNFTGGVTPITWTLEVNGSVSNLTGASGGIYTFNPLHAGTYTFYLNASDTHGSTSDLTTTVVVKAALVASLSSSPGTTQVGESSTLAYGFTGGVTPITWTLEVNGSVSNLTGASGGTYTFVPTHAATYTFYLNATDSVGSTSGATATVVVKPALVASLSSSPGTTQVGETSTLTYGFTGGVTPITWTLERNGSVSNLTGASGGTYAFVPAHAGTYTFYLNATDAVGSTSRATATVMVKAALVASLSSSPGTTQVGETSTLTYGFTGGVTPITWTLERNGSVSNLTGASGGTYAFVPAHAGTYTFYLNATDAVGSTSGATATVVVKAALVASLSSSPGTISVSSSSTLTYGLTGGVTPITWTLEVNGSVSNLSGASGGTYTFTPAHTGTYTFYLNATDAVGSVSSATATVVVKTGLVASLSSSPGTTQVGETSTLTYSLTGGVTPITWTLEVNGSVSNLTGASGGTYTFVPAHAGTYTFYLNATDAFANASNATAIVVVKAALVASLSSSPGTTQVGETSILTYGFTGGVTPITWTLEVNGSVSNLSGASGGTYTFVPAYAGSYTFYLNATDKVGSVSKVTSTVTVEQALIANLTASPANTHVGGSSTLNFSFTGGVTPIRWTLEVSGSLANLSGATGGRYVFSPLHAGIYTFYLNATDSVSSISSATAIVTVGPVISVSPTQGPIGATYTVTGSGFGISSDATVSFAGANQTPTACSAGTFAGTVVTANGTGGFRCAFEVPREDPGSYSVLGEDRASSTLTAVQAFTVTALAISVTPTQGPVGATTTVSGTGFSESVPLSSLVFDAKAILSCLSGSLTTGPTGSFTCTFKVPSGTSGTTVNATDTGDQSALGAFAVTTPAIVTNPTQGPVGATVTISGTGFSVTTPIASLVLDSKTISACAVGSLATGPAGGFSCTFSVPVGATGTSVVATDVGGQAAISSFTATTPTVTASPTQGPQGANLTISGAGFSVSTSLTSLVLDSVTISRCTSGSLTSGATGLFSCTLKVPSGTSGTVVVATDAGGVTASATFTVTTPTIRLSSTSGQVGSSLTIIASGFSVSTDPTVAFNGADQTPTGCAAGTYAGPLITTNATGGFSCTFKVPSGPSSTTITVTDPGGQSASEAFTVTPAVGPAGSTAFPWAALIAVLAAVAVALFLVVLFLGRRRRRSSSPAAAPVTEWSGATPPAGPSGPAMGPAPPSAGTPYTPDWQEPPPPKEEQLSDRTQPAAPEAVEPIPPVEPAAPPEVLPGPDIPIVPPAPPAPTPKATAAEPEAEPDIDSLMAELDQISSEILKRTPKKPSLAPPEESPPDEEPPA